MIKNYLQSFIELFYPKLCICCDEESYSGRLPVCINCLYQLPLTEMESNLHNTFTERISGRFPFHTGTALFYFSKGGKVQQLIHKAKYGGDKEIAYLLGIWMGKKLLNSDNFKDLDYIVSVPLHKSKLRSRGFNQSEEFGKGIAAELNVIYKSDALLRKKVSISQTTKNRVERLNNVLESFQLKNFEDLENKHILLVDDVITTGATLEACAEKLLSIKNLKLSLVTIAIAMD